jgi:hypothetical protein
LKTTFILVGLAFLCVIILSVIRFFNRLGKPVNKALSDSYYYHARKDVIAYSPMGNWFELGYTETTANVELFSVLSLDFGKDDKTIFWKGEPQAVDYATFRVDEHGIAKDAADVYYTVWAGKELQKIIGADPKTYQPYRLPKETYNQGWGRDHQSVFLYGKKVDVDGKTFSRINQSLGYDSLNFYAIVYRSGMAEDSTLVLKKDSNPGGKIEGINDFYARVNNTILHSNWKNEFSMIAFDSIDQVTIFDERNLIINNRLVSDGKRLDDVDVTTLEIVARDYLKDSSSAYFDGQKITGADTKTFSYVFENYSKDNRYVYYKTDVLSGINPQKLTIDYSNNTISDGKVTFKNGVQVK